MRIGIDMDDTVCNTKESLIKYSKTFCEYNSLDYDDLWHNETNKNIFLNTHLRKIYETATLKENSQEVLNKLKNTGHNLYIITARSNTYINDIESIIKEYLKNKNIDVDYIIINAKDKVDACIKNNIDIMIDDNLYNYNSLINNNIKTILFDDSNKHQGVKMRINNWKEIFKFIN